jgi:hypothetical protein
MSVIVNVTFEAILLMSAAEFTPDRRSKYESAVTIALDIPGAVVKITSVSETQMRRRLLQTSTTAETTVETTVSVALAQVSLVSTRATFPVLFGPLLTEEIRVIEVSRTLSVLSPAAFELISSTLDYTRISRLDFSGGTVAIEYLLDSEVPMPVVPTPTTTTPIANTNDWDLFGLENVIIICLCVVACYLVYQTVLSVINRIVTACRGGAYEYHTDMHESSNMPQRKPHRHRKTKNHASNWAQPYQSLTPSLQVFEPTKARNLEAQGQAGEYMKQSNLHASLQTAGFMKYLLP